VPEGTAVTPHSWGTHRDGALCLVNKTSLLVSAEWRVHRPDDVTENIQSEGRAPLELQATKCSLDGPFGRPTRRWEDHFH
jgi:hypothetical protein